MLPVAVGFGSFAVQSVASVVAIVAVANDGFCCVLLLLSFCFLFSFSFFGDLAAFDLPDFGPLLLLSAWTTTDVGSSTALAPDVDVTAADSAWLAEDCATMVALLDGCLSEISGNLCVSSVCWRGVDEKRDATDNRIK